MRYSTFALLGILLCQALVGQDRIPVGFAKTDVTPAEPVVLAGYGSRTAPFESIDTKLYARAMVIGDQEPHAIVVLDNCGITREITAAVRKRLVPHGFPADHIMVATTHTHNAPALDGYAPILWQGRMSAEMVRATNAYTQKVIKKMVAVILAAKKNTQPLNVFWAQGKVTFGGNRRVINEGKWGGFGFQMDAPVDHSLPILCAKDDQGIVRGIWSNYACHCTTVGAKNNVNGDWAGFANEDMEKAFPQAVAIMSIGCGADVGPQPSGSLEIARTHGQSIAAEVKKLIAGKKWKRLTKAPNSRTTIVHLPLEKPKPKSHWEKQALGRGFEKQLAIKMLAEISRNGSISDKVEYPLTTWTFDKDLAIVFMPGEVVVDYAVRLKTELDWKRIWITGWANRMPGYIPSRKVLMQGGYEADFSQVYYGLPGRYQPGIEDLICSRVGSMIGKEFGAKNDARPSPFHKLPSREKVTFDQFRVYYRQLTSEQKSICNRASELALLAKPAVASIDSKLGRRTNWFDLYGDSVSRVFLRQKNGDEQIQWNSGQIDAETRVLCFTGGLGYLSEPETKGFELALSTGDSVNLDIVREPTVWSSQKGTFELLYIPIWRSDQDSAGYFFVVFSKPPVPDRPIVFSMQSSQQGSLRWFGLDARQHMKTDLSKLKQLLNSVE